MIACFHFRVHENMLWKPFFFSSFSGTLGIISLNIKGKWCFISSLRKVEFGTSLKALSICQNWLAGTLPDQSF